MKDFLEKLKFGLDKNSLSSENKEILRVMLDLKAISLYKNKYYLNDGFVCGRLDISANGTGFISNKDFKRDLLVENKFISNAKIGDIVLAKILKKKKDRVYAKILISIIPAFLSSVVYTKKFGKEILGVNIKSGLATSLNATQKSLKALPLNTLLKIDNRQNKIVEVLGNLDDPLVDEKISLAIYNKNKEFPPVCEEEARAYGESVDINFYPNRTDLRGLNFCTIDPVDAKDFDDAIFYDEINNSLFVAIADVSEYVKPFSALDKEAKNRGFSIYFPHIAIPMLPRVLSENLCSLRPNEDRLAFCFKIQFDKNYNVISEELIEAIINSKKRFNYDEVDDILATKKAPKNFEWLLSLNKITNFLRDERLKVGFDFRSLELRMSLDEKNNLINTKFESGSPSHSLIEDCMLLANKAAAKRIKKGVFRNHPPADLKKILSLIDDLASLGIEVDYKSDINALIGEIQEKANRLNIREDVDKLIIKAQQKANYASFSLGHFGLGFKTYTHFTSPIRRYSDLILHRLLKADKKMQDYLLLNIENTLNKINELEKEADKVAFDFMDRKFARWAKDRIGENFICYIDENKNYTSAKLDDKIKGARIFLINYTNEILTRVLVKIVDVDIAKAVIFGKVVKKIDVYERI